MITKKQGMTCDVRLQVAICDVRQQVAMCGCEPILLKLAMHFQACDVRWHLGTSFSNNLRYEDWNALSFGVYSNSVAQKLSLLAIFDPKNPFLTNLIDDRIKIKAEI